VGVVRVAVAIVVVEGGVLVALLAREEVASRSRTRSRLTLGSVFSSLFLSLFFLFLHVLHHHIVL
jgi:hypothetical protein